MASVPARADSQIRTVASAPAEASFETVGAEGDAEDQTVVPGEGLQRAALIVAGIRADVPQPDHPILAGRGESGTVGAEGDTHRPALMAAEQVGHLTREDIPDLDDAVRPGRRDADSRPIEGQPVGRAIRSVEAVGGGPGRRVHRQAHEEGLGGIR